MKLRELIDRLEKIEREHGADAEVLASIDLGGDRHAEYALKDVRHVDWLGFEHHEQIVYITITKEDTA